MAKKKEKVIFKSLEHARNHLSRMGLNPDRAWNNSTKIDGVRQLHIAIRGFQYIEIPEKHLESVQIRKVTDHWFEDSKWLNVYFYARKYVRKETVLQDYQLASDGYYLQKEFDPMPGDAFYPDYNPEDNYPDKPDEWEDEPTGINYDGIGDNHLS